MQTFRNTFPTIGAWTIPRRPSCGSEWGERRRPTSRKLQRVGPFGDGALQPSFAIILDLCSIRWQIVSSMDMAVYRLNTPRIACATKRGRHGSIGPTNLLPPPHPLIAGSFISFQRLDPPRQFGVSCTLEPRFSHWAGVLAEIESACTGPASSSASTALIRRCRASSLSP